MSHRQMHICLHFKKVVYPGEKCLRTRIQYIKASQVALVVKNLPANAGDERDMDSIPGWGDPLEEGMATHSSILAWRILWTDEPGGLQSIRSQRMGHD